MTLPPDDELLARIDAATPGPWNVGKAFADAHHRGNKITPIHAADVDRPDGSWLIAWLFKNATAETLANATYIATFDPPSVRALLARAQAAEADNVRLLEDMQTIANRRFALAAEKGVMREALKLAATWFEDYERQHRFKRTAEGNLKADTNAERAAYLRAALSEPRP